MIADRQDGSHGRPHFTHTVFRGSATAMVTSVDKEREAVSTFGALLRHHRIAAGLSQEMLAERARMSVNGISALERGERRSPYRDTLALLTKALGLTLAAAAELEAAAARPRQPREPIASKVGFECGSHDRTNLPAARTDLIGRDREIAEILRMLRESRLVTITGTGGVGKTQTALTVGNALLNNSLAGIWLVELAPLAKESFILPALEQAVGVQSPPNRPQAEALIAFLRRSSSLLILDNCGHVIADAATVADTLLRECPNLRILATSREQLRIAGEKRYLLASLTFPSSQQIDQLTTAQCAEYSAVALFSQRAAAADQQFVLSDENVAVVADICRQLDGIPLAIELAASRMALFSAQQLRIGIAAPIQCADKRTS